VFEHMVKLTEPLCRKMDAALADILIKDPLASKAMWPKTIRNPPRQKPPNLMNIVALRPQIPP